jgi:hypothetical protein
MNAQPKNKRVVFTMGGKGGVGKNRPDGRPS